MKLSSGHTFAAATEKDQFISSTMRFCCLSVLISVDGQLVRFLIISLSFFLLPFFKRCSSGFNIYKL